VRTSLSCAARSTGSLQARTAIGGTFGKADLGLRGLGDHIEVFLVIADDD
jgi:hypothetical protein